MGADFDGNRIAEKRIAEAALTGQDWLDLGALGLTRLPDGLFRLSRLRRLNLGRSDRLAPGGWDRDFNVTFHRNNLVSADLPRLTALTGLTEISLQGSDCADLGFLSAMVGLTYLSFSNTPVASLAPIQGLAALQHLECSFTQVSDLAPIQGLAALQHLDCRFTQVSDLAPIQGLAALQHLDCSNRRLNDVPLAVWMKPSLRTLHLANTHIPNVPDEELGYDCLDSLRAHLNDLEAGAERMRDVKLLILGGCDPKVSSQATRRRAPRATLSLTAVCREGSRQ